MMRIGSGFDVHQLAEGRKLILGGVEIEHPLGLLGHSDADVLIHAICDACLGAAGLGDIGVHFPPSDDQYKNIDSRVLLKEVSKMLGENNWVIENLDCTIIAEKPRMRPYIENMCNNIACDLNVSPDQVNIKATTTEGLGYIGQEQGIAAQATVLIEAEN